MRIATDLSPYTANDSPDWSKITGTIVSGGFVPDSWKNIKFTVGGDGIQPVDGKSFLSWQPGGGWQARATCGPWEKPILQGQFMVYCADGTGTILVTPFVQIA
jgi:hypothetical protein